MEQKKVTVNIPLKMWEFFRMVFPKGSAFGDMSLFISEILNVFKNSISELKVFSKEEVLELVDLTSIWELDFSRFPAKQQLLNELEQHYRIQKFTHFPEEFKAKIEGLREYQCFVLARWCRGLWDSDQEHIYEKALHFFMREE